MASIWSAEFQKRRSDIRNFQQHDQESLCEAYERFNLLMRKCPNHNIDAMEQMLIFTGGMEMQLWMLLNASAGGSIMNKTVEEVKELIEQMCQNEYYYTNNERSTKTVGMIDKDKETAYKVEIELLKRKLAEKETAYKVEIELLKRKLAEKASLEANVSIVQEVYDFCQENRLNGHCVPEGNSEEVNYMGNYQKSNPNSNTYNCGWKDHPNFKWNQSQNQNQGAQQNPPQRKPTPLEETLNQFMKMSQTIQAMVEKPEAPMT